MFVLSGSSLFAKKERRHPSVMKLLRKQVLLRKRILRVRSKVSGTSACPRLSVSFSNKHIYAQFIDDVAQKTMLYQSTLEPAFRSSGLIANLKSASEFGGLVGERAKSLGIDRVVFDRRGRRFHGCVKAFADAARESGLVF